MNDKVEVISVPIMVSRKDIPEPIDITPLPYERDEDPQVKIRAYDMFINSMDDMDQIATLLAIPSKSLRTWARQGNWVARKQELLDVAMKASDQRMQEFLIRERQPTVERHLAVAKKLEESIGKTVDKLQEGDGSMEPRTLKTLSEALSSAAGVSGKATNITDLGVGSMNDTQGGKKTPVVIINMSPTLSMKTD